ncbi:hypothetical protein [Breoghania sp.]|uniref:hypothetical protein n=1 Tax=Breoghania sp. TaxID=2065378 RepID=UPI002603160F|nr:hypothetical protein [Breoghania sp.]MDJ0930745.1 hypothetical protein [Breoghania sp.]
MPMTAVAHEHAVAEPHLKNFPVSFFAVVMGLAGLTLATQRLEHTFGGSALVPLTLLGITILAFIVIAVFYGTKAA